MSKIINIFIVETSYLLYEGLSLAIAKTGLSANVQQCSSIEEAEKYICYRPEAILIINPSLVQNNLKSFQTLKNKWEKAKWIGLIYMFYDNTLLAMFDGIVNIYDSPSIISNTIKRVIDSEGKKNVENTEELLSEREIEVLRLMAEGLSSKEIADKLNISVNTAITHRKNISQKTGIKSLSGLTIYAIVNKLIKLD